ncbi:hypothetical protein TNCV_3476231 [Trichonephila clavipes]|nr:hypothetical protein TNCV_3476231 [Trichonephila clavipes]
MWVRLGSTDLMAGKVVFLRGLLSPIRVVDLTVMSPLRILFEVVRSALKRTYTPFLEAFSLLRLPEKPPVCKANSLPGVNPSSTPFLSDKYHPCGLAPFDPWTGSGPWTGGCGSLYWTIRKIVWENSDPGTNSEVSCDNGNDVSFSKHDPTVREPDLLILSLLLQASQHIHCHRFPYDLEQKKRKLVLLCFEENRD